MTHSDRLPPAEDVSLMLTSATGVVLAAARSPTGKRLVDPSLLQVSDGHLCHLFGCTPPDFSGVLSAQQIYLTS